MLRVGDRQIDYQESGDGPAILFVPGAFSTPKAWRSLQENLPSGYRFVSTSLCGYGDTQETRTPDDIDMRHEIDVIEAVATKINVPLHLVGHSFGGNVALAAALAGRIEILSICTFEANPFGILCERGQCGLYES